MPCCAGGVEHGTFGLGCRWGGHVVTDSHGTHGTHARSQPQGQHQAAQEALCREPPGGAGAHRRSHPHLLQQRQRGERASGYVAVEVQAGS